MKIRKFEELECWQEARVLVRMVYKIISTNPRFEKDYRLANQITGAGISIMNNIAEGFDSQSNLEFRRFLRISRRHTSEVETCLYVALDQNYINQDVFDEIYNRCEKVRKIIDGLLRYLKEHSQRAQRAQPAQRA